MKVAFIGLGWVTQKIWLPSFTTIEGIEIIAGADPQETSRDNFFNITKCQNTYDCSKEIYKNNPDLCIIATPNVFHASMALEALQHNCHVLIEKPICTKKTDWHKIKTLANQREKYIFTSHAARFRRDIQLLFQQIQNGKIGKIRSIEAEWIRSKGIPNSKSWFVDSQLAVGGAFLDLGSHLIDVCLYLAQPESIRSLLNIHQQDFLNNKGFEAVWKKDATFDLDLQEVSVEDSGIFSGILDDDVYLGIKVAWASHQKSDLTKFLIKGTKGELELKTLFGFSDNGPEIPRLIYRYQGKEEFTDIAYEIKGLEYQRQAEEVIKNIRLNNASIIKNEYHHIEMMVDVFENAYKEK